MSKRSFTEFSTGAQSDISQMLSHADELLRAAQALKNDLEAFHTNPEPEHDVYLILKRHSQSIKSSTQSLGLGQDEVVSVHCCRMEGFSALPSLLRHLGLSYL